MATRILDEGIDFDFISVDALYNPGGIESLPIDIQFSEKYAAMQQQNSTNCVVNGDKKYTRKELAAMDLFAFRDKFNTSSEYHKILGLRRKEQKRENTELHRLKEKRDRLQREKELLQKEINWYAINLMYNGNA